MYELDTGTYGLGIMCFSPYVNEMGLDLVWGGQPYIRYPIVVEGFKKTSKGTLPRPTMTVANLGGNISKLFKACNSFIGCKVTRKRTLVKYLDAVNFAPVPPATEGVNDYADPNTSLPEEVYYIDRKASENPSVISVELAVAWDVTGVKLPLRQVIRDTCVWEYRGEDCGYTGGPVADVDDIPTIFSSKDKCSRHMSGCKLRFGDNAQLPASFCPSVGLIR